MNRKQRLVIGSVSSLLGVVAAAAVAVAAGGGPLPPGSHWPPGPPAKYDASVPQVARDQGVGERLLVVAAKGAYQTQAEALADASTYAFGDVQGFYALPVGQFVGLREALGRGGDWILGSVFRTQEGAEAFAELARVAGASVTISPRVVSMPGVYAGLGQEAAPNGSGPLLVPVPGSLPPGRTS